MTGPEVGEEPVEVVDEDDRAVAVVPRWLVRERHLLHRCTYVVVLDRKGRVYVHRRSSTKDVYPGSYDVISGGVNAVGESYERWPAREVEEELGVGATPTFRFTHRYEGTDGRCLGGVFDVVWDGPIRWQVEEVAWGAFLGLDELDRMIEREPFCRDSLEVFDRWRREVLTAR